MAQHKMVTFRLHRTAVVFIVIGAVLLGVFIFAGGYFLGLRGSAVARLRGPARPAAAQSPSSATPQPRNPEPPHSAHLAVRVGIFNSEEEAKGFVQQLTVRKIAAAVVPVTTSAGVTLYTVQTGDYATRAAAADAARTLHDEHGLDTAVVPAGMESLKVP